MKDNEKNTNPNKKGIEFNKKEMDITFEKLLKKSAIVINQRHADPGKNVNLSHKNKIFGYIKTIFDLPPKLTLSKFEKDYIEKGISSSSITLKLIIKRFYSFIFINEETDNIKSQVDVIIDLVKTARQKILPLPKKYLIEKLKKFRKIKITKINKNVPSWELTNELNNFIDNKELHIKSTEKMIDLLMKVDISEDDKSEKIENFCTSLKDKLNDPNNRENTKKLYKFVEDIIPKLKTLYNSTGVESSYKPLKECISLCKQLRPESEFKKIEKDRENKSHDRKSLKNEFEMEKLIINNANETIDQVNKLNGTNISEIKVSELPKLKNCEKFLEKSSSENIDRKIFDSYVKEAKEEIEKVIAEKLKKTMFGTEVPNSKTILNKILDMF